MKTLTRLTLFSLVCCLIPRSSLADDKKEGKVDPSGTWRWVFDTNGNSIASVLTLDRDKDGKLSGKLAANDREIEVTDAKIEGDLLSFHVKFDMRDRQVTGLFEGKIDGDQVNGNTEFKTDQGTREIAWKAERSVKAADLVGKWNIVVDSPNGELKSELHIVAKGDEISVRVKTPDGKETQARDVKLEKNHVHYALDLKYEGSDLTINVKGRPYGSKLSGSMAYDLGGDSGELEFRGVREKKSK